MTANMPRQIISLNGSRQNNWKRKYDLHSIHGLPGSIKLNENLFFESLSDYLSLKIKYVFGLIRSWNSKFRKQASLLLCLTNIACLTILLSRSRGEFNFVYIFYCHKAYLCKLLWSGQITLSPLTIILFWNRIKLNKQTKFHKNNLYWCFSSLFNFLLL